MTRAPIARKLRRNLTDAEVVLWSRLRNRQMRGLKFRRQMPVGKYIADFACEEHVEAADQPRKSALEAEGYLVLRFWNNDVLKDVDAVMDEIGRTIAVRT